MPCPASIWLDGRTLLSVGDSPHIYLRGMPGCVRIMPTPLSQLALPVFDSPLNLHPLHGAGALHASFCTLTAFLLSGFESAVTSQEGMVMVWAIRSHKPMKVFTTDRSRAPPHRASGMQVVGTGDWRHQGVVVQGLTGLDGART